MLGRREAERGGVAPPSSPPLGGARPVPALAGLAGAPGHVGGDGVVGAGGAEAVVAAAAAGVQLGGLAGAPAGEALGDAGGAAAQGVGGAQRAGGAAVPALRRRQALRRPGRDLAVAAQVGQPRYGEGTGHAHGRFGIVEGEPWRPERGKRKRERESSRKFQESLEEVSVFIFMNIEHSAN